MDGSHGGWVLALAIAWVALSATASSAQLPPAVVSSAQLPPATASSAQVFALIPPAITSFPSPLEGQAFSQGEPVAIKVTVKGSFIQSVIANITLPDQSVQQVGLTRQSNHPKISNYTGTFLATQQVGSYFITVAVRAYKNITATANRTFAVVDSTGPVSSAPLVAPNPAASNPTAAATVTDSHSPTAAAEAYVDVAPAPGNGLPLQPVDGTFDELSEEVAGTLVLGTLPDGPHQACVRGRDSAQNWGAATCSHFVIDRTAPETSNAQVAPSPTAIPPTATAQGTDGLTPLAAAEAYIDTDPGLGQGFPLQAADGLFDELEEDVTGSLPIAGLSQGQHTAFVRVKDSAGNWDSTPASATFTVDASGPQTAGVIVSPTPTGTNPTVTAIATDLLSTVAAAEFFVDSDPGIGLGNPMSPSDGTFNSGTEALTGTIYIAPLSDGLHTAYVRAKDSLNNWGPPNSAPFTVDRTAPVLTPVSPQNQTYNFTDSLGSMNLILQSDETLSSATWSLDSGVDQPLTDGGGNQWTGQASNLARGSHSITYRGTDIAGNSGQETTVYFTVFLEATATGCTDASSKLNGEWDQVTLLPSQPIIDHDGTCITFGADNVIFDGSRQAGVVIDGNDDFDTDIAIDLNGHSEVTVRNAEIKDFYDGVSGGGSQNVKIHGMSIKSNQGTGIAWWDGNGFEIYGNTIRSNLVYGMFGGNTQNNQIYSNNILLNNGWGMIFIHIQGSTLRDNDIAANVDGGIRLAGTNSYGNLIYHNGFRENNEGLNQVFAGPSNNNQWSNGYPSGGNYWSNFDEMVEGCSDSNGDSICDSPYTDSGAGATVTDDYPFIIMWAWR